MATRLGEMSIPGTGHEFQACHRPSRYVPYKGTFVPYDGTFGVPDQGQMLDVWGWHPDDVNPTVKIHKDPQIYHLIRQIHKRLPDRN